MSILEAPHDKCPFCGYGERIDYEADKRYTAGYFYVCDCGYSVGMEPIITYEQFEASINDLRVQLRGLIASVDGIDQSIDKTSEFISNQAGARVRKMQDRTRGPINSREFMADGRDWELIAPKSNEKRRELRRNKGELEARADSLRREIAKLRNVYLQYAYLYDAT